MPASRDGIYVGESSRSLHERAFEHVQDAKSFSAKSHIVKHWMMAHPSLNSPPKVAFSISGRYRDCLSRQVGEALRINMSKDNLLNSKGEYGSNSISRLSVQIDTWEGRKRALLEDEKEEMMKKEVEEFKALKMRRINPPPSPVQDTSTRTDTGGRRGVNTPTGTMCNIVNEVKDDQTDKHNTMGNEEEKEKPAPAPEYETDEEEFL